MSTETTTEPHHSPVLQTVPLGAQWPTLDPFLFCAHHDDDYPAGDDAMAPAVPIDDRELGMDFSGQDGWSMYHGRTVPGFPQPPPPRLRDGDLRAQGPHRPLRLARRRGAASGGATCSGSPPAGASSTPRCSRCSIATDPNPLELFQIWLNLPAADKLVEPYFTMFWDGDVPVVREVDDEGRATEVTVIAGVARRRDAARRPARLVRGSRPTPTSPSCTCASSPGARFDAAGRRRCRHGAGALRVRGRHRCGWPTSRSATTPAWPSEPTSRVELVAGAAEVDVLVLQGRPIGEPVARYGPFVMNTEAEIEQAFADYRETALRRLAVGRRRPDPRARPAPVRPPRRRPRRGAGGGLTAAFGALRVPFSSDYSRLLAGSSRAGGTGCASSS